MKSNNYIALPLLAIGIALTAFSFYWLDLEHKEARRVPNSPVLNADSLSGWVPPAAVSGRSEARAASEPVSNVPVARISVPRVGINAPVETLTLDGNGAMQDPTTPMAAAWYDFSAKPGAKGNVVLAGHVDYEKFGPAVFWRLRDLKPGDKIEVALQDGTVFDYEVSSLNYYDAASAPVQEITGPTPYEAMTLITCGGNFNRGNLTYNQRLVVRAIRTPSSTAAATQ